MSCLRVGFCEINIWSHMVTYGHIWSRMVIYGHYFLCGGLCVSVGLCVFVCGVGVLFQGGVCDATTPATQA